MTRKKDAKFFIRLFIPLCLIVVIIGYAYFQTRNLVRGIDIDIYEPKNYSSFSESGITIRGKITRSSAVFINDRKIFLDEEGYFAEKILLSPGLNRVTIKAEDRFKREIKEELELVYKENG